MQLRWKESKKSLVWSGSPPFLGKQSKELRAAQRHSHPRQGGAGTMQQPLRSLHCGLPRDRRQISASAEKKAKIQNQCKISLEMMMIHQLIQYGFKCLKRSSKKRRGRGRAPVPRCSCDGGRLGEPWAARLAAQVSRAEAPREEERAEPWH